MTISLDRLHQLLAGCAHDSDMASALRELIAYREQIPAVSAEMRSDLVEWEWLDKGVT